MSDLAIFKSGNLPAHIRKLGVDATTKALMGGGGGKRISIEGGVWRLLDGSLEIAKREERTLEAVIVAASEKVGRIYYEGTYRKGESAVPSCWSSDGDRPDPSVKNPQSDACQTCPQNIRGSGTGDTRACRFFQKLAIVFENDLDGDVYQLQLPATSIFGEGEAGAWPLQSYARILAAREVPIVAVVTEMRFDTDSATPKVVFKPVRVLDEDELDIVLEQGQSEAAKQAITQHVPQQADGEDEDEFEKPAKKSKKPTVVARDEDDDEEVEKPKKTRKRKPKPEPEPEPEDDDDEDDDEDDEPEPEPAPKKTRKRKPEPEPEPEDDEDDDEDDEPVRKKGRSKDKEEPTDKKKALLDILDEWDD